MNKKKWRECMFWLPDDKPSSTVAVVVVNKKGKVKRLSYKHWNEQNQGYSTRKTLTYIPQTNRGKQRYESGVDESKGKYMTVNIRKRGYSVHRLVAKAWVPNPDNKPQVNHIDGNRSNNHYKNLEWVTNKENAKHAHDNGLRDHVYQSNVRMTEDRKIIIDPYILEGMSPMEIAKKVDGISHETIRLYRKEFFPEIKTKCKKRQCIK